MLIAYQSPSEVSLYVLWVILVFEAFILFDKSQFLIESSWHESIIMLSIGINIFLFLLFFFVEIRIIIKVEVFWNIARNHHISDIKGEFGYGMALLVSHLEFGNKLQKVSWKKWE